LYCPPRKANCPPRKANCPPRNANCPLRKANCPPRKAKLNCPPRKANCPRTVYFLERILLGNKNPMIQISIPVSKELHYDLQLTNNTNSNITSGNPLIPIPVSVMDTNANSTFIFVYLQK